MCVWLWEGKDLLVWYAKRSRVSAADAELLTTAADSTELRGRVVAEAPDVEADGPA
jgi:hypothetical protein